MISALSAAATKEQTSPTLPKSDKDIELSGPLSRALVALKNIYDHGWVVERPKGAGIAGTGGAQIDGSMGMEHDPTTFEQQNAAMAMASMQNGIMPP